MAKIKSIIEKYDLNSKGFLRTILELSKNDFPVEMKLAKEKFPVKFARYSESGKVVPAEMFVAICEHFTISHQRILEKIVAFYNISEINEIKQIVNWFGLKLPKTDEEISRKFGLKST
ncbi:hypothetical protein OU798_16035 [Prolixibacteraceae bacterium Z1-6]|uniref:Uncharacterized protein n=1 Tax=Draconibacterium aestuarii TaxID=2998507 RepID=A0A9X3FF08_9BACT|nr:hypothetical protein [Prolixibacteraceae bacterium Z1-6]